MLDRRERDDLRLLRAVAAGSVTAREVGKALGLAPATASAVLVRARERGLVVSGEGSPLTWSPSSSGQELLDAHPERPAAAA